MALLRVASWNVREGKPVDTGLSQPAALAGIAHLLDDLRVDIVALQEVDFAGSGRSRILDVIRDETELTHGAWHILSDSSFDPGRRAGVALASRFPLKDSEQVTFTNPRLSTVVNGETIRSHDKGLVAATAVLPDVDVSVVSLHCVPFKMFGHRAEAAIFRSLWQEISAVLAGFTTGPAIVCGDFNTHRRDLTSAPNGHPLARAITEPTQVDDAVDDILFSGEFRLASARTTATFSDHRLCVAELALTGAARGDASLLAQDPGPVRSLAGRRRGAPRPVCRA